MTMDSPNAMNPENSGRRLQALAERLRPCMQCGTCTASCGSAAAMDLTPRQLWRLLQTEDWDSLWESRTFWLCSSCYFCTLRCPRGLPLTETMAALKAEAIRRGRIRDRRGPLFYGSFLKSVRRYGRVRETALMTRYILALGSPKAALALAPLGWKLALHGKLELRAPALLPSRGKLDALFEKVAELESRP